MSAQAQRETEPETSLIPPVVRGGTEVPYPPDASGNAIVDLELVVETDGTVSGATVLKGDEPFAEQARQAVLGWRFLPAHRGDERIRTRIRARVEFHQEAPTAKVSPPTPLGPATRPGSAPAPSPMKPEEVPEEVKVHGTRSEIGQTTLSATDVREMPGAFGDAFRAIQALPGVTPVVSALPYFYIRGAPPNDNGYYIDGIRVPLLFHVGVGESVIHPALLDHVDFYPGAAPASYGGFAGATIAGQIRDPVTPSSHGEANLRVIDAGALVEAPVDNGRFSALAAGRYGYPGPILSAITPRVQLGYWDYQSRATWHIADRATLGVFAFGSHDYLGTAPSNNGQVGPAVETFGSDFHRLDVRYDRALDDGRIRVAATVGFDSMGGAGAHENAPAIVTTVTNLSAAARLEIDKKLSSDVRLRGGADVHLDHYEFAQGQAPTNASGLPLPPVPSSADPPPTNVASGANADVVWRVTQRVEVVTGIRFDVFESTRESGPSGAMASTIVPAVDPRLSTRVTVAPGLAWLSTFGLAHQYPVLRVGLVPAILVSVPGFPTGDSQLQTVAQASQGLEFALPGDLAVTTTGFLSGWSGLTDLTSNCIQVMQATSPLEGQGTPPPSVPWTCPSNDPVHGTAYGIEVLLRRSLSKRLGGWLSYTLTRSTRDEHFITPSGGSALATVVSDYDRTHMLNAILAYDLGRRWRTGGRFMFYTGTPYSNLAGNVPVPPYNTRRTAPFYRLDVRLEKRWPFARDRYVAFIAEVQNVTFNKEETTFGLSCRANQTGSVSSPVTQCTPSSIGPVTIPSVGVEASF